VTPPVVALESFAEPWRRDYNSVVMSDLLAIVRNLNRLAAVQRSGLLDTPAEETFDRFTRLATRLFKTPVALVSIVDGERQFFKSAIGLPEPWQTRRETPLTHSFCKHAVALQEPLVIGDARKDPTYRDNPAVRDLKIIAYAGVPLMVSGNALGAFCVIDDQPHAWSYDEVRMLRDLAGCVMHEIELRTRLREADDRVRQLENVTH
jgi:GAF domain-containing protein